MELKNIPPAGDYTHIALSGKLDEEAVSFVREELTALLCARKRPAILDMTQVGSISPEGIKLLWDLAEVLNSSEYSVVLYNPQPLVREFLETAGISGKMFVETNLSAALAKMEV